MKRKYFFGILICLVLLCGGVFLLTSNYINDNQINQEVTNASNANFHFNKVYGYNTAGVNFTVSIQKCNADGIGGELASRSIKYSDSASGKIGKTEDIGGSYKYRLVTGALFSSKQDGLRYQHNGYYARFSGSLIYDNGDPATSINQNFTSSGFDQTCGPTGWFTGVSLNFEIYWIVRLTLDENEGPSINNNVYYSTYNARLTTSSVTKPTRTGHTFKGYYTDKENGDQWLGLDENGNIIVNTAYLTQSKARPKTLYAHWTANKYTVTLSRNGGSNGTGSVTATYDSAMPNINIPSKGGYKFLGYWDKTSGGTQYYDANGNSVRNWNKASNATLYARWERNNYKIDINFYKPNGSTQNGGTFDLYKQLSGGSETLIQEGLSNEIEGSAYLQYEGKFILKNVLPLTGTTISSVRLSNGDGTLSTSGKTINGKTIIDTITYTASQTGPPNGDGNWDNAIQIYTAYNTLTATLKYQDDATADAKRSTTYNSNRTSLSLPSPTRTGYRFLGWSLTQNDTGVYYTPESDFNDVSINGKTVSDPNVENLSFNLYAIWQPYEYEVVFNKNSNQAVGSMNNQSFTYDIAQNLSTNQFTRAGYNFLGWSRSSNATTAEYQDKVSVKNLITTNNGIVTLYAIWGINQNSLTINLDGGKFETNLINNSYTQSLESYQMTFLETPIKAGYIFDGWEITGDAKVELAQYYLSTKTFNGTNDYQSLGREFMYTDKITINLFGYMDNWGEYASKNLRMISCTETGGWNIEPGTDGQIQAVMFQQQKGYSIIKTSSKWSRLAKGWHSFTMTFDKDYFYLYVDGILMGKSAKWTNQIGYNSGNAIFLGAEAGTSISSPVGNYFSGSMQKVVIVNNYITGIQEIYETTLEDKSLLAYDNLNDYILIMGSGNCTIKAKWKETIASKITEGYEDAGTYYISSAADLAKLIYTTENQDVGNGYTFIQTADIDLSGTYLPIGRLKSFSATYDGQGYTISGLKIDDTISNKNNEYLEEYGGLFANASGAKIKNVIIEDATIYGQNAGIIAGSGNDGTNISNCVVSGTVNGTNAGSIIGNGNGASISACLAKGVNTASFAGGSAKVDSCIYKLTGGTKGASKSFNNYSAWIYPSNFAYPMPKAFMWYPYPELTKESLNTWISG